MKKQILMTILLMSAIWYGCTKENDNYGQTQTPDYCTTDTSEFLNFTWHQVDDSCQTILFSSNRYWYMNDSVQGFWYYNGCNIFTSHGYQYVINELSPNSLKLTFVTDYKDGIYSRIYYR